MNNQEKKQLNKEGKSNSKLQLTTLNIIGIILIAICLPLIIIDLIFVFKAAANPDQVPMVFNGALLTIDSDSMTITRGENGEIINGAFNKGDLIYIKKVDVKDLVEGDIVTYRAPDGVFVTHRIVGFLDDGNLELAGDVLHSVETIEPSWIQGVYVMRFAELGHIAEFIGSPWGLLVMLGVPALILFIPDFFKKKKEQDKEKMKTLELQAELQKLREEKEALEKAKEAESASQEN